MIVLCIKLAVWAAGCQERSLQLHIFNSPPLLFLSPLHLQAYKEHALLSVCLLSRADADVDLGLINIQKYQTQIVVLYKRSSLR